MAIEYGNADEPNKSTAARKGVPTPKATMPGKNMVEAGTQALPVDTPPKPKIGRPRTGFNKKEYNRQYMRDLRKAKPLGMKVKEWREKNAK